MKEHLVLGTYSLPKTYSEFEKMLEFSHLNGLNLIDTAHCYNQGLSEKWLGQTSISKNFTIATKVGKTYNKEGNLIVSLKKEKIINQIKLSLKRLNRPFLEILFFHDYEYGKDIQEIISLIEEINKKGYAKKIGLSNFPFEISKQLIEKKLIFIIQKDLNEISQEELNYSQKKGIETWLYRPFLKGNLIRRGKNPKEIISKILNENKNIRIIFGASSFEQLNWLK